MAWEKGVEAEAKREGYGSWTRMWELKPRRGAMELAKRGGRLRPNAGKGRVWQKARGECQRLGSEAKGGLRRWKRE